MTFASTLRKSLFALAALAAAFTLASCGSGAVGAPPSPVVVSPVVTILPANVTVYSGLPTTFVVSGGTGPYVVTSSDQAIVPISGGVTGGGFTIVPNPVLVETTVTLTVRDSGGNAVPPLPTAVLTVRPGTVTNTLTITPNPTQAASCSPGICSGGDADVSVTISQGGIPIGARGVRFDVIAGDFRFITTPPGTQPEQTALSVTTITDETGVARARIRATNLAPNQTALLQVTDLGTGAFRRQAFVISQFTGNTPAFFLLPDSLTFTGAFDDQCASGLSAFVTIFGGAPPYTISGGASGFVAIPAGVSESGGRFLIQLTNNAQCFANIPVGVTDSTGRTLTLTVSNVLGTRPAPVVPAISIAPANFSLVCGGQASLTISGGTPNGNGDFIVNSDHPRVFPAARGRTVTVTRLQGDFAGANYPDTVHITVSDGQTGAAATGNPVPIHCN